MNQLKLLCLLVVVFSGCTHRDVSKGVSQTENRPKTVLISIDGLRPEFYLSDQFHTPNLKSWLKKAAYAEGVLPVFPTLTYPNHVSMVTGVKPVKHGIYSNTIFNFKEGLTPLWYWEEDYIKAPTLWQLAKKHGYTTAIMRWPASVGADVDWILPEIFAATGEKKTDWEKIVESVDKKFLNEILETTSVKPIEKIEDVDGFNTKATVHVLKKYNPDLTFIHLIEIDYMQHMTGRDSAETAKSVEKTDRLLGEIISAVDLKHTRVIITGDHGFLNYHRVLNLNAFFAQKKWIQVKDKKMIDWKVLIHPDGGQAAVYCKDKSIEADVLKALKEFSKNRYRILSKSDVQKLETYPEASFVLSANEDYVFGASFDRELEEKYNHPRGHHGYLQIDSRIQTGFLAFGAGIKKQKIKNMNILDIAPTVSSLMDLKLREVNPEIEGQGRVLPLTN